MKHLIISPKYFEYQCITHSYHYTLKNYEYRCITHLHRRMLRKTRTPTLEHRYATSSSDSTDTYVTEYTSSNAIEGVVPIGCKQPVVDDTVYVSFTQVPSSSEQIVTVQGSGFESFERAQGYEFELSCEIEGTLTNVTTESETLSSSSSDTEILISNVSPLRVRPESHLTVRICI